MKKKSPHWNILAAASELPVRSVLFSLACREFPIANSEMHSLNLTQKHIKCIRPCIYVNKEIVPREERQNSRLKRTFSSPEIFDRIQSLECTCKIIVGPKGKVLVQLRALFSHVMCVGQPPSPSSRVNSDYECCGRFFINTA
jgi:hypothetical protein